jgi:hypothetical protein
VSGAAEPGLELRVDAPDGRSWTVALTGPSLTIGRHRDNDLSLAPHGVSGHHCVIERGPAGFVVRDLGSTNGTWVDGSRIAGPVLLELGAKLAIGAYLLGVQQPAQAPVRTPARARVHLAELPPLAQIPAHGSLLHDPDHDEDQRRAIARLRRYAHEWLEAGEPTRLLVRGRALRELLDRCSDALEDPTRPAELAVSEVEARFLGASQARQRRARRLAWVGAPLLVLAVLGLGTLGVGRLIAGNGPAPSPESSAVAGEPEPPANAEAVTALTPASQAGPAPVAKQTIEHTVIPAETLEDIARRYAVPLRSLSRWNGIDEHAPLVPGQLIRVVTVDPPLPQQRIIYRPETRQSWTSLAQRFDVPVAKLRAQNPEFEGEPGPGDELSVWIDPKPLVRNTNVEVPEFEVRPDAISVGSPRNGKLLDGIQFPAEDGLYKRRKPYIMWSSSYMAKHLREAIAAFRYQYAFEGELVVADMSQRGGGPFPPHKSHQAGRDVDIWLPTLKGVYQRNHLLRDVRPNPDEADWYALYAFLQALAQTEAVQQVFLDYSLHDRVYKAAKRMGASDAELDAMIAYPRGRYYRKALLQHSEAHTHHIHVRFKCGPQDQCSGGIDEDPGD